MTAVISVSQLIVLLPFAISLAARIGVPKLLCFAARVAALLLLGVENSAAILDFMIGTAVAGLPIQQRIQHCRAALSFSRAPCAQPLAMPATRV